MDPNRDLKRLRHFYGAVASDQNSTILRLVNGERILELGCGYGTLLQDAEILGRKVIGLDINLKMLKMGRSLYPSLKAKLVQGDMGMLPFKEKSFHAVILRESLHHVSLEEVFPEILRVCKKEIIVFEPNPNWVLRMCRKIISHKDQEIPLKDLLTTLERHRIVIKRVIFRDPFAFPLSGGFVGWELVPPIKILFQFLLWVDKALRIFFHFIKIERAMSWRYLVKGVLSETGGKR